MKQANLLVIGGGIAGITSALEGAARGLKVYLIEKTSQIGGSPLNYFCKATDKCNKCSVCMVYRAISKLREEPKIKLKINSEIVKVEKKADSYIVTFIGPEGEELLEVGAIIVATGFGLYKPETKGEYGYNRFSKVITAFEFEKAIQSKGSLVAAFGHIKKIAYILCVGSRDIKEKDYCSKVCCMNAMKSANLIANRWPVVETNIFYIDIQTFDRNFDSFLNSCQKKSNIGFIRAIPGKIYQFPKGLVLRYSSPSSGELIDESYDLIILATALTPKDDSHNLAKILGLKTDRKGFLASEDYLGVSTSRSGIFLAGTCQHPKDIRQSVIHAKASVNIAEKYLKAASP